jgi:hypothetical protein
MFDALKSKGYQVEFHSHAQAILGIDFPEAVGELEKALLEQDHWIRRRRDKGNSTP